MRIEEISGKTLNDRQGKKDQLIRSNSKDGHLSYSSSEKNSRSRVDLPESNEVDDLPRLSDLRYHQALRLDQSSFESQHISLNFEAHSDRNGSHRSLRDSEKQRSFHSLAPAPEKKTKNRRQQIDEP